MKYKSDKYNFACDPIVVSYTQRRIMELRGERPPIMDEPMHPYMRKRLDEIKEQQDKK